jgi:hypothetical protein
MVGGERAQHLRHAGGKPAVAATPEVLHVGRVEEEPVGLLQAVQIDDHLVRIAVKIFAVAGGAVRLQLQHGEHIHVVDPEAGLGRETVLHQRVVHILRQLGRGVGSQRPPLTVGPPLADFEILRVIDGQALGLDGDLQWNDTEDGIIDVMTLRRKAGLGTARHQRRKLRNQRIAQRVVMGELREGQRAIPGAHLGIADNDHPSGRSGGIGNGLPQRIRDEVLGERLADHVR